MICNIGKRPVFTLLNVRIYEDIGKIFILKEEILYENIGNILNYSFYEWINEDIGNLFITWEKILKYW